MDRSRRAFIKTLGLGVSAAALPAWVTRCRTAGTLPNIVLILADDMGYSDVGCYGGEIRTPNIDRLARGGLRFTDFYNSARCCPSRASLLTGLYPHQAGVGGMMNDAGRDGYRGDLNHGCLTIAQALKPAGYASYAVGKWHVTRFWNGEGPKHNWPLQRGFDRYFGSINGGGNYFSPNGLIRDNEMLERPAGDFYYTDAITDHAVRFIQDHQTQQAGRPFFLYCAYTAPHFPLHARTDDIDAYKGHFDAGWDILRRERYRRMKHMGLIRSNWALSPRDSRVPPWEEADYKDWELRRMEVYAAQVERMDQGIGRIVAELERTHTLDNSLIFFLSDNGGCAERITESWRDWLINGPLKVGQNLPPGAPPVRMFNDPRYMPGGPDTFQSCGIPWANVSNTPFRLYKHFGHHGGVLTPFIVHWPARVEARGEFRHQPGHLIDIMPTCLDAAGVSFPQEHSGHPLLPLEGRSLLPAFDGHPIQRDALFFDHEGNRSVLEGRWKLVALRNRPWELYDLDADKTELHDLAAVEPDHVERMARMWEEWARRARVLPRPGD